MALLRVLALGLGVTYLDGHWDRVTRLTTSNVESTIESAISDGRTLFVRIIASEG